jgi:DNA-binding GntR family transcriptional regulator
MGLDAIAARQPEAAEPVAQQVMQRSRSIILEVIDQ